MMKLQYKFEEIIKDNSSCWTDTGTNKLGVEEATEYADYVCIEEVSKECAIICLEEQICRLYNIKVCLEDDLEVESSDFGLGYHQCTKDIINGLAENISELQQQIKLLKNGND